MKSIGSFPIAAPSANMTGISIEAVAVLEVISESMTESPMMMKRSTRVETDASW
jgi:hypothetical protein